MQREFYGVIIGPLPTALYTIGIIKAINCFYQPGCNYFRLFIILEIPINRGPMINKRWEMIWMWIVGLSLLTPLSSTIKLKEVISNNTPATRLNNLIFFLAVSFFWQNMNKIALTKINNFAGVLTRYMLIRHGRHQTIVCDCLPEVSNRQILNS